MHHKAILGALSLAVAIVGYVPYITDILSHKTKPHALSWLVWSALAAIACAVQIAGKGGAGAWLMGLTAFVTFTIFLLSFKYGDKNILTVDWLSLLFAGIALGLWVVTDNPLASILLISVVDAIGGFFPTLRKSFHAPYDETISLYILYALSLGFSLVALEQFTLVNALYPATFVLINLSMALFLWRRRQIVGRPQ